MSMAETDTLVFIPAWNEEENLPAVLDELAQGMPSADVLVSTTARRTPPPTSRARTARTCSRSERTAGCAWASPPATHTRTSTATRSSAAWTRTGSIRSTSSHGCSRSSAQARPTSQSARASRRGTATRRTGTARRASRRLGTAVAAARDAPRARPALPRRDERDVRREPARDARTRHAVLRAARRRSNRCSACATPGLVVAEVPVHMRERASGESKLRGSKAVRLVLTVVGTLLLYGVWRRLRRR